MPMDLNLMKHPPAKYTISDELKRAATNPKSVKPAFVRNILTLFQRQDRVVEIRDQIQPSLV